MLLVILLVAVLLVQMYYQNALLHLPGLRAVQAKAARDDLGETHAEDAAAHLHQCHNHGWCGNLREDGIIGRGWSETTMQSTISALTPGQG
ncbi:MAG: hypothetical protein R2912_02585 [Eubacteriales bacterium]